VRVIVKCKGGRRSQNHDAEDGGLGAEEGRHSDDVGWAGIFVVDLVVSYHFNEMIIIVVDCHYQI